MKKYLGYIMIFLLTVLISGCAKENLNVTNKGSGTKSEQADTETTIITYGYIDSNNFEDLNSSVQERIVAFNKSQSEYFIEVEKYGNDSYIDGLKALNADLAAGKGPDIIGNP